MDKSGNNQNWKAAMAVYLIAETRSDNDQELKPAYGKAAGSALTTFAVKVVAAGGASALENDLFLDSLKLNEFASTEKVSAC